MNGVPVCVQHIYTHRQEPGKEGEGTGVRRCEEGGDICTRNASHVNESPVSVGELNFPYLHNILHLVAQVSALMGV